MKRRGKVLRDGSTGSGLLIVDGQQYPFLVGKLWKSEKPPTPGMVVEVEFEQHGEIRAVYASAESQPVTDQTVSWLKAVAGVGVANPIAAVLLVLSWTLLTAVSVQSPLANQDFTFWQVLGHLDSAKTAQAISQGHDQSGAGIYGLLALATVASPFLQIAWKDKRATLAGLLPVVLMAAVALTFHSRFDRGFGSTGPTAFSTTTKQMASVSLGVGAYMSALIGLYFAARGIRQLLSVGTARERDQQNARGAAA